MEPFIDGGIFEILLALVMGYTLNFIFLRKYLLLVFSALVLLCPLLLLVFQQGEIFYMLTTICFLNAVLLVVLLWKHRSTHAVTPLFDLMKLKKTLVMKKEPEINPVSPGKR